MKTTITTESDLFVECNSRRFVQQDIKAGPLLISVTPPINEDYWLMRVPVSANQAIVCFPKFRTLGIGFQKETDWNTNLPYQQDTESIYNHIKVNKGDDSISDERCIAAINLLKQAIETSNL